MGLNFGIQIDGGWNFSGTEEFIDEMSLGTPIAKVNHK